MPTQREKAVELLISLETGEQEPVSYINPDKYIHHNLAVGDGLEGFAAVVQAAPPSGFKTKVVRAFEDGGFAFTHTEYDFFGPKVGFDVFRFEGGKIFEHLTRILLALVFVLPLAAQDSPATQRLKIRFPEYEKRITKVAPNVYVANGYTVSSTAMIVGDSGVVIVDPGQVVPGSREIRAEFAKITGKPIKAIIYTHGHGDHTGGAAAFVDEGSGVQVWARSNYGSEEARNRETGIVGGARPADSQGFDLPKEQRMGIGIAMPPDRRPAGIMMRDGMRSQGGGPPRRPPSVEPTHTFSEERRKLSIAGIELELVAAPGETEDQIYVWYPAERVVFAGDNLYRSWPNVYPLRGSARRSIRDWIASYTKMIAEDPLHAVGGHSTPFVGDGKEVITAHRDALKYVYDETIKGASDYKTPDELVASINLPEKWAKLDHLGDYYGSVEGTIRDIYAQDLGWFDGDTLNLHRESPLKQSQRIAELAGGVDALMAKAKAALAKDDPLGAAQLAQHAMRLRPDDPAPKLLLADALAIVGERTFNAPARNYTLAYSNMLRRQARGEK